MELEHLLGTSPISLEGLKKRSEDSIQEITQLRLAMIEIHHVTMSVKTETILIDLVTNKDKIIVEILQNTPDKTMEVEAVVVEEEAIETSKTAARTENTETMTTKAATTDL